MGPEILPLVLLPPTLRCLAVYLALVPRRWRVAVFSIGSLAIAGAWLSAGSRFWFSVLFCVAVLAVAVVHLSWRLLGEFFSLRRADVAQGSACTGCDGTP